MVFTSADEQRHSGATWGSQLQCTGGMPAPQELLIQRHELESVAAATRAEFSALQEGCEEAAIQEQALRRQLDALKVARFAVQAK